MKPVSPRGESRFKGVTFHKHSGKWMARAMVRGERLSLGYHDTEEEAAMAYDRAVYARVPGASCNFPVGEYPELSGERDRHQVCMPSRAAQEDQGMTQAGTARQAKRSYRYDVCPQGHGMRDPENIVVAHNGYQSCRTCINDRQRRKRAEKRGTRLRSKAREEAARRKARAARASVPLGRQGDGDRMLEVVGLRRDTQALRVEVRLLKIAAEAGDKLVGNLRKRIGGLMGDNARLSTRRRVAKATELVAAGLAGGALSTVAWLLTP